MSPFQDMLCTICSRKIDAEKEVAEGRPVWQYAEGFVPHDKFRPLSKSGVRGGINRMRLVARHERYAHDLCMKQAKRTVYQAREVTHA